jgi:hypothetical protein
LIRTQFAEAAVSKIESGTTANGPYAEFNAAVGAATAGAYEGPVAKLGGGPEEVAHKIGNAISRRRPRARYPVTPSARIMLGLRRMLPDRAWEAFTGTSFPRPKP